MPIALLDLTNTLPPRIAELEISINQFGRLCGVSSSEISLMLNGHKRISNERAELFNATIKSLEKIRDAVHPIPVDFSNVERIRAIIKDFETGALITGISYQGTQNVTSEIEFGCDF